MHLHATETPSAKTFGGQHLSYRDFSTYEIAPPPKSVWASDNSDDVDESSISEVDDFFTVYFEDQDAQEPGKCMVSVIVAMVSTCILCYTVLDVYRRMPNLIKPIYHLQ